VETPWGFESPRPHDPKVSWLGLTTMYLDYWLAYRLRFLALRAKWTKVQPATGDWPADCEAVAHGVQVSPRDRLRARIFATRILTCQLSM
jgi:hypothetical protein